MTAAGDELTAHGNLHGLAAMIGIPGFPVAAVLISRSLGRNPAWAGARVPLRWAAHLTWISVAVMVASIAVLLPLNGGAFGPAVAIGWSNRLVVLSYAAWLITLGWGAPSVAPATPAISAAGEESTR
jgi:hypothetical protein